jgi:zinc transporter ZupT
LGRVIQFLREGDRRFWLLLAAGIAFAVIMAATKNFALVGVGGAFIAIASANRSRGAAEESRRLPRHERPLMIASVLLGVTMLAGIIVFLLVK